MADDAGSPVELTAEGSTPAPNSRRALAASLAMVLALAGVAGWLGWNAYAAQQDDQLRAMFLDAGRQGALNLSTISHTDADAAVERILNSSTGAFHDDFQQRAEPFVQIVKQTQSSSEGTITEAALESVGDDEAQVLVAVSVTTTSVEAPEQPTRLWRMRINVQRADDEAKISEVGFVS
ncbi:Mce protein [Mycolicibacterium sp.]|uniref:Mce protein n=1 Tax=Mycolicibacterium sp. TaxID=2320850 RepID=UPI00355FA693